MITPADLSAAPLLADLHARAFARPWSADEIEKLLQNPTTFALLAQRDGAAAQGFVMAWAIGADSELLTVAVTPEARGAGLGAALVGAALAAAAARGAEQMHLEVAEDNASARALYAKLGFEAAGRRPGYYKTEAGQVDAIVMRLALKAPD